MKSEKPNSDTGREHPAGFRGNVTDSQAGGTHSGTRALSRLILELPEFAEVATAWQILPPAIRAGILAMVRSANENV